MGVYQYTALTPAGDRVSGMLTAPSEQALLAELENRRLTPVEVAPTQAASTRRRPSLRSLGEAYGQLADLLRAGVPLLRCLRLIAARKSRPRLAEMFRELADSVEKGVDLAAAMDNAPDVFASVHVAMIRAGEKGGFLDSVMDRLCKLVQRQVELRDKVVGSLIYPTMVVSVGSVVAVGIFGFFVPRFKPMFAKLGSDLPGITKVVFHISDAITLYGAYTALALVLLGVGAWRVLKLPQVQARVVRLKNNLPVIGRLIRSLAVARFCQLLGAMLDNGVPLLPSLAIARDGATNQLLRDAIDQAADSARAGHALTPPLEASGLFDDDILEMIRLGEQANNLGEVLTRVGDTVEKRLDRLLTGAVRLIEPLMLLAIALVVGLVAVSLILPMAKMSSAMH